MEPAIELRNVRKSFTVWHDRPNSVKTLLAQASKLSVKLGRREHKLVLENLSISINPGEFVGIMGRNGAGKSTLLKLIAKIYTPTSGELIVRGNIAPLLELGAGFADELSGYENIFLNASILGFGREQIARQLNAIIEFSELGTAISQPVRNYSSGMLVRLGFSIAVHLEASILLFDEILAVGDVGFQQKCLKKIDELHSAGRTIVLITHTPSQVEQFCSRCIVFEKGGVIYDGPPDAGSATYQALF